MISRRRFCHRASQVAGVAALSTAVQRARAAAADSVSGGGQTVADATVARWMKRAGGPKGWRIGVGLNGFMSSSGDFKKTYPIWEILGFCAKHRFDGIELVQGWPMGPYPGVQETRRVEALKDLYDRYKLKVYTIQPGAPGRPFAPDRAERENWLKAFRGQIELCKKLGCDFIGHWPGGGLGDQSIDQAIDHCAHSYRQAARICADAGLWLSFEVEPPFIFNTLDHLKRILEGADHPACKTNYDPSHFDLMSGAKGKPEEMLRALGVKHIGHVHLTDTDGTMFGGTSKHLPCGDGHCDIAASLAMLWDGGYRGWIMIDGWKIEDVYDACLKGQKAIQAQLKK